MACPFCQNTATKSTVYPRMSFNNKQFEYRRCSNCSLEYLDPLPLTDDYLAMYPPAYQGGTTDSSILPDIYTKMPGLRFSYGYQFDLVKKHAVAGARMLDYGCGNGHFIANALHRGFLCDGSEFSAEYVRVLKSAFPQSEFYTIEEVLSNDFQVKYDVIRLSNVLEHLTTPGEVIETLIKRLSAGGILLIEGPVEANFNLAASFRKVYFGAKRMFRPKATVSSPPYHIFFSNRKNQREFFQECGLSELHFEVGEDAWPFPPSIESARGIKNKSMAIIASISQRVSAASGKNWGNMFIYCGKS